MDITITIPNIKDYVTEEVAHAADLAYGENGTSLYDAVFLSSKDEGLLERFINDAVTMLLRHTADISTKTSSGISFNVPDIPTEGSSPLQAEVIRYIMLYASSGFFAQRRPALVPEYTTRIQNALDNIIAILRTRKAPTRS